MVALAWGVPLAAPAGAATTSVGQLFTPTYGCGGGFHTYLITGVASGTSYVVPQAGVITSWSFQDGAVAVPGLKLKVGRSAGGGAYMIVAEATAGTQVTNSVNTYPAHIPVKAGDLIGLVQNGGNCATETDSSMDSAVYVLADQAPGTTTAFSPFTGFKFPVSVQIAVDCVVPKLKGKTLRAAKKALKAASCRLGTVRTQGQTTGRVRRQRPAAGTVLPPGGKVNLRLR